MPKVSKKIQKFITVELIENPGKPAEYRIGLMLVNGNDDHLKMSIDHITAETKALLTKVATGREARFIHDQLARLEGENGPLPGFENVTHTGT
jgi:hypothetical protein